MANIERDYTTARDLIRHAESNGAFAAHDDPHALRDAVKRLHGNARGAVEVADKIALNLRHLPDAELLAERNAMADELDAIGLDAIGGQADWRGAVDDPRLIETLARVIENRHGTLHGIGSTLREALSEYKRGQ